jgi:hypothetical protein
MEAVGGNVTAADFPGPITAVSPIRATVKDRHARGRQNPESEQPKAQPPAGRQRRSRPQGTASVLVVDDDDAHLIDEYG